MAKVQYKFKAYQPRKLKLASTTVKPGEANLKALQTQKENLDKRLRAEGIDPNNLGGEFDNRTALGKLFNVTPNQNLLFDIIEVIDRPTQMVKQAIIAGQKGEDVLEAALEGLSGERERVEGVELLQELGVKTGETPVEEFVTNIASDIVLDPLTYLPAGFLTKGLKKLTTKTKTILLDTALETQEALVRRIAAEFPDKSIDDVLEIVAARRGEDVFRLGSGTDFDGDLYITKDGRKSLGSNYRNSIAGLEGRAEKLTEIIEARRLDPNAYPDFPKVYDYVDNEVGIYNDIKKGIEATDPGNVKVIMTTTQNRLSDIVVLKRYKNTNYFTQVGKLEAKMIEAMGATATLEATFKTVKKTVTGADGVKREVTERLVDGFKFKGGPKAFDFGEDIGKRLTKFLQEKIDATGTTISDKLKEIYKVKKGSVSVTDAIKGNTVLEQQYRDIVFDMMKKKGTDILVFNVGGKPIYMKLEQARKHLVLGSRGFEFGSGSGKIAKIRKVGNVQELYDVSKAARKQIEQTVSQGATLEEAVEIYNASRRQFRLFPAIGLDENALKAIEKSGDFISQDEVIQQFAKKEFTYEMGILEWLGEREDLIGVVAKQLDTFLVNFRNLFSFKGDLPQEFIDSVKGIEGGTMYKLQAQSERLAEIKRQFIARNPEAGKHLSALFEAGAYMDADGVLRRLDRSYDAASFFDYAYKRTVDSRPIILPEFADAATRDNFILEYNKRYFQYGNMVREQGMTLAQLRAKKKLVFDIVESNGATKMIIKGNLDNATLKEFVDYVGNAVDKPFVKFGQKRLSKEAIKVIKENPELYKEFADLQDDLIQDLIKEGGFTDLPAELSGKIGYMRHIMTKESYEALRLSLPNVASKFAKPGTDLLTNRNFFGSIEEVNRALREFAGLDVDLFDADAFNAVEDLIKVTQRKVEQKQMLSLVLNAKGKRGDKLFRVVSNTMPKKNLLPNETLIKSFDEEFSVLYKNLSKGSQDELKSILAGMGYGPNSSIVIHKNVKNILKRVEKAYIDLPDFIKKYDKFLNTWKGLTLITPGFHMRNYFGNMFNSYAVGMGVVDQGRYSVIAMKEMKTFDDVAKKLAKGLKVTDAERKIFDTVSGFFNSGIAQTHRGIRDLEQLKEATAAALKGNQAGLKTGYNKLIRLNFNFAEKMDDFQRYMLYRWSLDKTGDVAKASRTVSEALFDYHHLTNFEKDYMKRLFPFYTFMKNNFVFQAKNILRNPGAYARAGRAYQYYLEDIAGIDPSELPNYTTENMWLPIPMNIDKNDKESIAFLKANLPLSDFVELVENPFKKGAVSITAPVKLLIEFGIGRDLFTGQPLEDFPGQTNAMEPGTGILSGLRDKRGSFTITQSPLFQKIMNDIGLRSVSNFASIPLDIIDSLMGYQGDMEGIGDFLSRMGVLGVTEVEKLDLNVLYRDLEHLRELKKYYEQQTQNQLPVLP